MANFGNFCLLISLCLSLYALVAALIGVWRRQPGIVRSAEHAAYAATGTITLSFLALVYLLVANDFSVYHVATTSNRALPVFYKVAAVWGAHNGSMLLWVFFAAIFSGLTIFQNRNKYRDMMPYVLAVLMVNLSFFLFLNLFFSNPFHRLVQFFADGTAQIFFPADGQGLNPILQHWAMVIHPPIQYLGFIGFVVPFAFAIAALCSKQLGDTWIRTTRRWTLLTWIFLGVGLILGGKWAYVVLGWGGYWAWDPVENSSLMPWLISTAFLHSVIVQERKGMFKVWNVILVILSYLLSVFGTFLTRSGIVSSVHAFADSNLGKFFVLYMAGVLVVSLFLVLYRSDYLKSERRLDSFLSRESAFLFNNLVLVVACFSIFWGTMFPVFSEWVRGVKITVGAPFFNNINIPIGLLLLFLTGVGPLFAWRKTSAKSLRRSFFWPVLFSLAACIALVVAGMRNFYTVCCLTLCVFVLVTIVEEFLKGTLIRIRNKGENFLTAFINLTLKNKRRYGGYIVHFSIVLMFVGFAGNTFNRETTRQMEVGRQIEIGDYSLKMTGYEEGQTANYDFGKVVLEASKNGKVIGTLKPERRVFKTGSGQSTTTVALRSTPKEDLYVVFAGVSHDGSSYEVKAYVNPLVYWIWLGAAMMIFGTVITLLPNRKSEVRSQ